MKRCVAVLLLLALMFALDDVENQIVSFHIGLI